MPVGRALDFDGPGLKLFILFGFGWDFFVCCLAHRGSTGDSLLLQIFSGVVWQFRDLQLSRNTVHPSSSRGTFRVSFVLP